MAEAIVVSDDPALTRAVLLAVDEVVTVADNPTLVETATTIDDGAPLPAEFSLDASYPNPFNETTIIRYVLPEAAHVQLEVFDALGRLVAVLEDRNQAAGRYATPFDAGGLTSGLYVYRIVAGPFVQTRTISLVR